MEKKIDTPTLQKFLVEQLPEKIWYEHLPAHTALSPYDSDVIDMPEKHLFRWRTHPADSIGGFVRDTEWDYIVRLVEGKLDEDTFSKYCYQLHQIACPLKCNCSGCGYAISANWPTRAEAFMKILKP